MVRKWVFSLPTNGTEEGRSECYSLVEVLTELLPQASIEWESVKLDYGLLTIEDFGASPTIDDYLQLRDEVERLRAAIHGIAPWLSASLEDGICAPQYRAACDAVFFAVDDDSR